MIAAADAFFFDAAQFQGGAAMGTNPIDEPDEWGDLASFRAAAAAT